METQTHEFRASQQRFAHRGVLKDEPDLRVLCACARVRERARAHAHIWRHLLKNLFFLLFYVYKWLHVCVCTID